MSNFREFILTLSCRDAKGIVYAVSGLLFEAGCNILDSQQFGDVLSPDSTGLFFMRVHFEAPEDLSDTVKLGDGLRHCATALPCTPRCIRWRAASACC